MKFLQASDIFHSYHKALKPFKLESHIERFMLQNRVICPCQSKPKLSPLVSLK